MKTGFYAVKVGRVPGIYETWEECEKQIKGFSRPSYRKFKTMDEAVEFMNEGQKVQKIDQTLPAVYVDGSICFNNKTQLLIYGYGYVIIEPNGVVNEYYGNLLDDIELEELSDDIIKTRIIMRNISGELCGARRAIKEIIHKGYKEVNVFYDYEGVHLFATGDWKTKNPEILKYKDFVDNCGINVHFYGVGAHTGIKYNEMADKLAKQGASECYHKILTSTTDEMAHYKDIITSVGI